MIVRMYRQGLLHACCICRLIAYVSGRYTFSAPLPSLSHTPFTLSPHTYTHTLSPLPHTPPHSPLSLTHLYPSPASLSTCTVERQNSLEDMTEGYDTPPSSPTKTKKQKKAKSGKKKHFHFFRRKHKNGRVSPVVDGADTFSSSTSDLRTVSPSNFSVSGQSGESEGSQGSYENDENELAETLMNPGMLAASTHSDAHPKTSVISTHSDPGRHSRSNSGSHLVVPTLESWRAPGGSICKVSVIFSLARFAPLGLGLSAFAGVLHSAPSQ